MAIYGRSCINTNGTEFLIDDAIYNSELLKLLKLLSHHAVERTLNNFPWLWSWIRPSLNIKSAPPMDALSKKKKMPKNERIPSEDVIYYAVIYTRFLSPSQRFIRNARNENANFRKKKRERKKMFTIFPRRRLTVAGGWESGQAAVMSNKLNEQLCFITVRRFFSLQHLQ